MTSSTPRWRPGPTSCLLDNMSLDQLREAVRRRNATAPGVQLEASGGVTLATMRGHRRNGRGPRQRRRPDALGAGPGHRPGLSNPCRLRNGRWTRARRPPRPRLRPRGQHEQRGRAAGGRPGQRRRRRAGRRSRRPAAASTAARWQCRPGDGVLLSVLLFPPPALRRPAVLTAWAAVAVCETVRRLTGLPARIKWPNDVLLRGRKVCGILIEQGRGAVVGVGLNVRQTADDFAAAGLPSAASLSQFTDADLDARADGRDASPLYGRGIYAIAGRRSGDAGGVLEMSTSACSAAKCSPSATTAPFTGAGSLELGFDGIELRTAGDDASGAAAGNRVPFGGRGNGDRLDGK